MTRREMTARYAGRCDCGSTVHVGETMTYERPRRAIVACPRCAGAGPDATDTAYEDQCAAAWSKRRKQSTAATSR